MLAFLCALLSSGCVFVPEQVQLTHNGSPIFACEQTIPVITDAEALDADAFSLTTWNIYKGKLGGWKRDLHALGQHSDLLLLQEAYLEPELRGWLNQESLDWTMVEAFNLRGYWTGVLTGAKVSQLSPCAQRIREPYLRLPKTALLSYFSIRGHAVPLLVANVHGVNFTLGNSDLDAQLEAIEKVIAAHDGPVILAGDFNTWNSARMGVVDKLAASQHLQTVSFKRTPASRFGHSIDHIYYRGLLPLRSRIIEAYSSDNYPLTVTFRLDPDT